MLLLLLSFFCHFVILTSVAITQVCLGNKQGSALVFSSPEESIRVFKSYNSTVDHTATPHVKEISPPEKELIYKCDTHVVLILLTSN